MPISATCAALAEQWKASAERELATADNLRATGQDWPNVYWHAGFAVEHMLKAVRIKRDGLEVWPASDRGARWHQLEYIAERAGLKGEINQESSVNLAFGANWLTVKDWDQQRRYPGNAPSEMEARDLLNAVNDPTNGVMTWLLQIYQSL
jgi:hypothetical protein